jgi:hypothetical protein
LETEKLLLERKQLSSCSLFNQIIHPRPVYSFHKHITQGKMGKVERSSQITISFWFTLDTNMFEEAYPDIKRNGEEGHSGKISLLKLINPKEPMIITDSGDYIYSDFGRCQVSKTDILKNLSLLELESVRNNPNCFTGGLEKYANFKIKQNKAPQVKPKIYVNLRLDNSSPLQKILFNTTT